MLCTPTHSLSLRNDISRFITNAETGSKRHGLIPLVCLPQSCSPVLLPPNPLPLLTARSTLQDPLTQPGMS
jgi:hypothetical protein